MTQTLTLSDFLLARIAEDEIVANAASTWQVRDQDGWKDIPAEPAEWFAGDHGYGTGAVERRNAAPHDVGIVVYDEGCPNEAEAAHIARHDPAHVLAECEAKRRMIAQFDNVGWATYAVRDVLFELLALPYADHPDYRQEWKP